jgi:tetratricopeptide (TPR) repeat protein
MDAAEALASLADAKLDALGGPPELLGELETVRGHLYVARDPGIARVHYERALQAHRLAHGEDDRRVAETLVNLGIALDERGDHVGARERFEAALAIWEPLLGPEHPLVVQTGYSIGVGLLREDQPEAARPHFERAVASDCSDPVLAAHYQQALGSTLASLEGPDAGLPLFEAAHAAFLETLGPDHFETARSKLNLGRARVERGDTDAGLPMLVAAAAVLEETLGPDHPVVTEARTALASARQLAAAQ